MSAAVEDYVRAPYEETQIRGYVVLISKGLIVQQVVGTETGKLFASEGAAAQLAKRIQVERPEWDTIVLPLVAPR